VAFACRRMEAWNSGDVEAVLSSFAGHGKYVVSGQLTATAGACSSSGRRGQDGVVDALIDHIGAEADDLTAFVQVVDKKGVQAVKVGDGDVEDEVVAAGYDEHGHDLGQFSHRFLEGFDD